MSQALGCCPNCQTPVTVNIPGPAGQPSFTTVGVGGFTVPALGAQETIPLTDNTWMAVGNGYFIPGAGWFTLDTILGTQSGIFTYLNIAANTNAGAVIAAGTKVVVGSMGTDGVDGIGVTTTTTADFVIPAIGANVSNPDGFIHVASTAAMAVGSTLMISDGVDFGAFAVVSIPNATTFVAEFLGHTGDSAPGATIGASATVTPTGTQPPLAGALPTAFTDNSTGTASDTIAAGVGVQTLTIPLSSLATGLSTAALDLLTAYVPGYRFRILSFDFATTIVGAGAGASQVFNLEINAANVTGGVLTVNLASTDTIGEITSGTAITATNVGAAVDSISIEMAAGGTAFSSGSGYFVIRIQNLDSADAIASLADHINDLITALT